MKRVVHQREKNVRPARTERRSAEVSTRELGEQDDVSSEYERQELPKRELVHHVSSNHLDDDRDDPETPESDYERPTFDSRVFERASDDARRNNAVCD